MARFLSSRKSRRVARAPGFKPAFSIVFSETSRHIGILQRLPSASRKFWTTLEERKRVHAELEMDCDLRVVVSLVQETYNFRYQFDPPKHMLLAASDMKKGTDHTMYLKALCTA